MKLNALRPQEYRLFEKDASNCVRGEFYAALPPNHAMRPLFALLLLTSFVSAAEPVQLTLADFTNLTGEAPSGGWTTDGDNTIHLTGAGGGSLPIGDGLWLMLMFAGIYRMFFQNILP